MNNDILTLAKDCDLVQWNFDTLAFELSGNIESLETFYHKVYNKAIETAATIRETTTQN